MKATLLTISLLGLLIASGCQRHRHLSSDGQHEIVIDPPYITEVPIADAPPSDWGRLKRHFEVTPPEVAHSHLTCSICGFFPVH